MPHQEGDMPSGEPRRWDDIAQLIDARIPPAVKQEITPYRITVEETARDVAQLKTVVFGSTALGVRGMVERMGAMEGKIDTLLDQGKERQVILHSLWRTAEITRWIVVFFGSVAGLIIALNALGLIHL